MKIIWGIEDDYDDYDDYGERRVIGIREGLSEWWQKHKRTKITVTPGPGTAFKIIDMNDQISYLDPDTSAFTTIMSHNWNQLTKGARLEISWLEDEMFPRMTSTLLWGDWSWVD